MYSIQLALPRHTYTANLRVKQKDTQDHAKLLKLVELHGRMTRRRNNVVV